MSRRRPPITRRLLAGVGATALVAGVAVSLSPAASAASSRYPIAGTNPVLRGATDEGAIASSTKVNFGVLLAMRNESGAQALLQKISDPTSSVYGKWLTPAQFDASYAPTASSVDAVRSWLTKQGFTVTSPLSSGMLLGVSGTVGQIASTFSTSVHTFLSKGVRVPATTSALSLPSSTPAAARSAIATVVGLQGTRAHPDDTLPGPPPGARYGVQPCSAYYGQKVATQLPKAYGKHQPYAVCGYTPSQYQGAYGESSLISSGTTGKGVTVAITDAYASPTMLSDANTYSARHGQPQFLPGQYTEVRPSNYKVRSTADAQGWYGEETLDVEAVHGMAPGAKIVFESASDDGLGLDLDWAKTIDTHAADIITNSWSFGTDDVGGANIAFFKAFALEAAVTGITDNFSTGDSGDGTDGGTAPADLAVGFPADVPYVTGVGGTSVAIGSDNQRLAEFGWSNAYSTLTKKGYSPTPPGTYSSGGGGGTSTIFAQPFYQKGKVPTSLSEANGSKTPMRVIPDISMPGDPNTGMLVGETQTFSSGTKYSEYRIGGTSLASPLLAGVIAVADQDAGHSLGFANPLYYELLGTPAINDLTKPSSPVAQIRTNFTNGVSPAGGYTFILQTVDSESGTLADTPGYDNETGVGSPGGAAFFAAVPK